MFQLSVPADSFMPQYDAMVIMVVDREQMVVA